MSALRDVAKRKYRKLRGALPPGWTVHFLNGNPEDVSLTNLVAVPSWLLQQILQNNVRLPSASALEQILQSYAMDETEARQQLQVAEQRLSTAHQKLTRALLEAPTSAPAKTFVPKVVRRTGG
jgi:hypothetical protein